MCNARSSERLVPTQGTWTSGVQRAVGLDWGMYEGLRAGPAGQSSNRGGEGLSPGSWPQLCLPALYDLGRVSL